MPLWIVIVEWVNRLVLLGLVGLSIFSVTVILNRRRFFQKFILANASEGNWIQLSSRLSEVKELKQKSAQSESLQGRLVALVLAESDASPGQIERKVQAYLVEERIQFEKGLSTLATLGSNAPFVGLFGTVLGIIQAFGVLSLQKDSGAQVMGAVAEALVATAVGLFVAIPAVVAFNFFSTQLREILLECEVVRDRLLALRKD
ncbi:MAG: MotA/TolQ/ExbB proton channel family protein [Bdellovibrionales bacterium]|nr:MotA/TolQ/ExbB proton channel family protein [Bdellovibrionales bacterium]